MNPRRRIALLLASVALAISAPAAEPFLSHPPQRVLPVPSARSLPEHGRTLHVDPAAGSNRNPGSREQPWQSLAHAVTRLEPGDTLLLRGGTYYESVVVTAAGTPERPITIRAHPGELAVLDAGIREFFERPADSWEPVPQGAPDEFRSRRSYAAGGDGGNFGDSMVPLRMYGNFPDLRSPREFEGRTPRERAVYVGPGARRDEDTGRIHIRLSHTNHAELGHDNYRGETDPRKLPLVIPGADTALELKGARHIRLQDLVVRGAQQTTLRVTDAADIEFDHVTVYPVSYGLTVTHTAGLRVFNSAFRGFAAPWHPRSSGTDVDCFCPLGLVRLESGRGFEFAYNEFTDHHDGVQIRNVENLSFHHNYLEHFNDDVLDWNIDKKGPQPVWGTHHIFQNLIVRGLTVFSIHAGAPVDASAPTGVYIYRNIIDKRRGTYGGPPRLDDDPAKEADAKRGFNRPGRLIGDHGSPVWPAIYFYHNTVLDGGSLFVDHYGFGTGTKGLKASKRRVFNNIFVHRPSPDARGAAAKLLLPGAHAGDLQVGANLFWRDIYTGGAKAQPDSYVQLHRPAGLPDGMKPYRPDDAAHDFVANPEFRSWNAKSGQTDVSLRPESPAVNRGWALPPEWQDAVRPADSGRPDIGAIPANTKPWRVGIGQRIGIVPLEAGRGE